MTVTVSRVAAPPIDTRIERQIIIGLIVSDQFCLSIQPLITQDSFKSPFGKIISGWCQEYFDKYKKAPGRHIEDLFVNNSINLPSDDADAVREFLSSISDEYVRENTFNFEYCLDQAETYFQLTSLTALKENLATCLIGNRLEEAQGLISGYVRPARPVNKGGNPIADLDNILGAFKTQDLNVLLKLPGELGRMVGPISRGELMAIVGPSGVGKTWWLIMMAVSAVFRGLNVSFFSYEMPRDQITRRVQQLITGLPKKGDGGQILIPVWDCMLNQAGTCIDTRRTNRMRLLSSTGNVPDFDKAPANYTPCTVCRGATGRDNHWYPTSWLKSDQRHDISESMVIEKHRAIFSTQSGHVGDFHVMAAPSGQMSIGDVRTYIKNREYYEGVVTDMVITDSADKMRPEGRHGEERHGLYSIWMGHKALAEEFHAGVLTVSHSNTERTGKRVRQGDWSEDIRKLRESDVAWALNQPPAEKVGGRYLINMLKLRDGEFDLNRTVMALSCLKIGRPYLDSAIERKPPKDKKTPDSEPPVTVKKRKDEK